MQKTIEFINHDVKIFMNKAFQGENTMKGDGEYQIRNCLLPYQEDLIARRYWGHRISGELPPHFKGFIRKVIAYTDKSKGTINISIYVYGDSIQQGSGGIDVTDCFISYLDNAKEKHDNLIADVAWKIKKRSGAPW